MNSGSRNSGNSYSKCSVWTAVEAIVGNCEQTSADFCNQDPNNN